MPNSDDIQISLYLGEISSELNLNAIYRFSYQHVVRKLGPQSGQQKPVLKWLMEFPTYSTFLQ